MKCSICESEDVPVYDGKDDDRDMEVGTYLRMMTIPFEIGVRAFDGDTSNLHRVKIRFPTEVPLCKKCRKDLIVRSLRNY